MIAQTPAQKRKSQRGATLVEYAFVALFVLSLMFGISGFGHFLYIYHAISNSAKEGTRWASVNGATCNQDLSCNGTNGMNNLPASRADIEAYVRARLPVSVVSSSSQTYIHADFGTQAGSPDVCTKAVTDTTGASYGPEEKYPGCTVIVTISYPYNFSFPLLPTITTTTAPCLQPGWCITTTSEQVISH
jgi:Flp pilus assembly protein TadG